VYSLLVIAAWVFAFMGFMPSFGFPMGGSLFAYHVSITPSFSMPAFWLVTLIAVVAGLIGAAIGYANVVRSDKKVKTIGLIHYQRWMQART
jgi:hypothetical protein